MKNTSQSTNKNLFILNERKNLSYILKCHYPNATKEDIEDADLDICYNNIKNLPLKRYKWKDNYLKNVEDLSYDCKVNVKFKIGKGYKFTANDKESFGLNIYVDEVTVK